ncbi:MAG: hypothetical protein EKK41_21180 [Hyphomicrobiales bacterium]|nr:MAG: hypothetical protein EKK41_21180 [Hyphomicrobiales bacterium]
MTDPVNFDDPDNQQQLREVVAACSAQLDPQPVAMAIMAMAHLLQRLTLRVAPEVNDMMMNDLLQNIALQIGAQALHSPLLDIGTNPQRKAH